MYCTFCRKELLFLYCKFLLCFCWYIDDTKNTDLGLVSLIIDFHTHCFPERIAAKAIAHLAAAGAEVPYHNGPEQSLLAETKAMGADMAVVLNIATNPRQQKSVNDYAISINSLEGLTAFGSVHPESSDALDELERIKAAG